MQILVLIVFLSMAVAARAAENYTIEVVAQGGYESGQLLGLVEARTLAQPKIDYAFVLIGSNDATTDYAIRPPEEFQEILLKILRRITATGAKVFVSEIPPQIESVIAARKSYMPHANATIAPYNCAVHAAAALTSPTATVIPMYDYFIEHTTGTLEGWIEPDGLHPNLEGRRAIAKIYAEQLPIPQHSQKRVVLFGDSITRGSPFDPAPNKVADFLTSAVNANAAQYSGMYR